MTSNEAHIPPSILAYLDERAEGRARWRARNQYYYRYLEGIIRFLVPSGVKVLHVGCESPTLLKSLSPSRGLGINESEKMIRAAQSSDDAGTVRLEHRLLREIDEEFDYVIISDLLGYAGDIETVLRDARAVLSWNGRIVVTQYNPLWEPLLRFASWAGARMPSIEQNWVSRAEIIAFAHLAGLEPVKHATKMLLPRRLPLVSAFFNRVVANVFPFTHLGLFSYVVLRKAAASPGVPAPSLTVLVPARNEAGTIERIARELPTLGSYTEIIFVEGGSSDTTWEEVERVSAMALAGKKIVAMKQEGKGKGSAVREGFARASGDILLVYDADMTVPAAEVEKFYRALVENRGDFINGTRLVYPREREAMRFLNFLGNTFFSVAFSLLLKTPLTDTLCGTKALWRADYKRIESGRMFFGDFDPFGDFDLLFGAAKLNLRIIDLPVHYKDRVYGSTNIHRWRHGWMLLKMVAFASRKMYFI